MPSESGDPAGSIASGAARVAPRPWKALAMRLGATSRAALYLALSTAVLGLAAVAWHTYREVERELTEAALSQRSALVRIAATTLGDRFDGLIDLSVSLATRVRFRELVAAGRWSDAVAILRGVPADFPHVERLFLADAQGTLRADTPELPGVRGRDFAHREWYAGVSKDWKPHITSVYVRTAQPQRAVFAAAVPVRAPAGEVAAILVLQIRPEVFLRWLQEVDPGPGGAMLVLDAADRIAHPLSANGSAAPGGLADDALARQIAQGTAGTALGRGASDGEDLVYAHAPARRGWSVVARQPAAQVFAARDNQLRRAIVAFALIFALFAAAAGLAGTVAAQTRRAHEDRRARAELEREVESRTRELAAAGRELADLYENAPCGYHSVDAEGRIVRMNDTWLAWLGYSRDEVVGKKLHPELMTAASAEQFRTHWFPLFMRQGWLKEVEFEYVRKDGSTFPGSLQTTAIRDAAGRYVMSRTVVFDITERKRIENRVHTLNAQLEAANKELEAFSYSVSHDLRAPLRAVDGYARMVEEDYGAQLDDEGRRLLGVVRDEAGRMGQLIDDLLAFSRSGRQAMQLAPVDMDALAQEVLRELGAQYPAVQVSVAALPAATADRALLRQVWMNLLGNAFKYSSKCSAPHVEIGARAHGAELEYWVRDNGAGFDPRYADKLFGVFQRLHHAEEFPGTGVGLAIVQRVVARHGGRVAAAGKPGEGARFSFTLPAGKGQA